MERYTRKATRTLRIPCILFYLLLSLSYRTLYYQTIRRYTQKRKIAPHRFFEPVFGYYDGIAHKRLLHNVWAVYTIHMYLITYTKVLALSSVNSLHNDVDVGSGWNLPACNGPGRRVGVIISCNSAPASQSCQSCQSYLTAFLPHNLKPHPI
ncbi:hypothetical protein F5Y00DRAFT_60882 [Daldinia vernicosa]|uniref:uncharacterized protein n=1 Tax=Daldinia vernicosa TaxID=114800 RepID=UPI002007F6FA|nr:uncharacterized protein F5Y00DRAFT_60882 [Daldinia vernicosa]KAI0853823.1 hypothetical protein F5Y00DRAFT_60882 [Daldinia vernicosa]